MTNTENKTKTITPCELLSENTFPNSESINMRQKVYVYTDPETKAEYLIFVNIGNNGPVYNVTPRMK